MEAACETCGIDLEDDEIRTKIKSGKYLDDLGIISSDEMWGKIEDAGIDWWKNLKKTPWADRLVSELEELAPVFFLSSPGDCKAASTGKMFWIDEHYGDTDKLILARNKWFCAAPNRMLVDDSHKKVKGFREFGGDAFLWPCDTALIDGDEDIDEVMADLIEQTKETLEK